MPIWTLAFPVFLFAALFFVRHALPRMTLIAIGLVFVAIGAGSVALLEWRYTPARTAPLSVPLDLARSGEQAAPSFHAAITGPYDLLIQFDHEDDATGVECLLGTPGLELQCPRRDPLLALRWTVRDGGREVAQGGTDWTDWRAKQAAADPAVAARERKAYAAFEAKADPANHWPYFYAAGRFRAVAGHDYVVALTSLAPPGHLADLHPRLLVGLSGAATKGLGVTVLMFALLWILGGAGLILSTVRRGGRRA